MKSVTAAQVEALLPQTQCELCEHPGCKPYAKAIVEQGECIDKCLPGGVTVLKDIAQLLDVDPEPYVPEMLEKQKPDLLVVVREEDCIGCTKCIQACPVDAIIGAAKQMHTVITDACNGCELCIPPCPVDCIDLIELPQRSRTQRQQLAQQSKQRFDAHQQHLLRQQELIKLKHQKAKLSSQKDTVAARKQAIFEAMQRVKNKKAQDE
ncbi:MAG: RnfABCDGE type electron transport complex subunit B [Gammaproteobacteria bacterium]|nr:RnfABCDGE type electron transport complex subunit B [Gammaproteobacteria bacterium]MCH9744525.1 RnfABCDGE type electron transport complex subunit B [Gammaproteobacteria bacterium]